jgi:DNA-binding GntR family transcriptional regulator
MPATEQPKYRAIMDDYKSRIGMGSLRPGDRLPTIREVADSWQISHATATRVMRELCREGYAHVVGNATFVRDRGQAELTVMRLRWGGRPRNSLGADSPAPYAAFTGPAQMPGWNEITAAGLVEAPDYVADVMELPRGSEVLRRELVRRWRPTMDGARRVDPATPLRPFELVVHWYPAAWAKISPGLLVTGLDTGTSPLTDNGYGAQLAEEHFGRRPTTGLEAYHARLADEREARLLEIEAGSVVLGCIETWQDADGVTEYREAVMPMGVVRMTEYRDPNERDEG